MGGHQFRLDPIQTVKSNMIYINDHTEELDIAAALAKVSPQRREQALRFRFDAGRRLSLSAYLLLMEGLEKEYGITERKENLFLPTTPTFTSTSVIPGT